MITTRKGERADGSALNACSLTSGPVLVLNYRCAEPLVKPLHMTGQKGGEGVSNSVLISTPDSIWDCGRSLTSTVILSILRFSGLELLQASALLCQSQRPSRAGDKLMINLTATALRHEYGAALNPCLDNVLGMVLTLQSV